MDTHYDCIVIGGGPAGLSAALNLCQRGKNVLTVSGGETLLAKAQQIDNYLGLPGISGTELMERFRRHAESAGVRIRSGRVGNVMPCGNRFLVNVSGDILEAGTVILACGISRAKPVPGEAELLGRGVSYCATCDGMLYRGRAVAVWGLSDDAPREANFLQEIGCSVTYVAAKRPAGLNEKILFLAGHLEAVTGGSAVEAILVNGASFPVKGVFILRSAAPLDALVPGLKLSDGFVQTDAQMATNIPGLFAAGDLRGEPLQIANAVGDGLVAALSAVSYLDKEASPAS